MVPKVRPPKGPEHRDFKLLAAAAATISVPLTQLLLLRDTANIIITIVAAVVAVAATLLGSRRAK